MKNQYGKSHFQNRINNINLKLRPNSSLNYHFSNNSGNHSYIVAEGIRKKNMNFSYLNDSSGTTRYDSTFLLLSKDRPMYNTGKYTATKIKYKLDNKSILYEDTLKLKEKINELQKEIKSAKRDINKKDEEINKREKTLIMAKNILKGTSFRDLLEVNIINKLKDNYRYLQLKTKEQIEENNKLIDKIKKAKLNELEYNNNNDILLLKQKVNEYNKN